MRIPVLVFLLLATGQYMDTMKMEASRLDAGSAWMAWTVVALASVVFVSVVLIGRRKRHPAALLALEALVAAIVALVPPFEWVRVFGFNTWTMAMVAGVAQPLATAWLGVVCLRLLHQRRHASQPASRGVPGQAISGQPKEESG